MRKGRSPGWKCQKFMMMGCKKLFLSLFLIWPIAFFYDVRAQNGGFRLNAEQLEAFRNEANRKTHNLSNYIAIIADKSKNQEIRTKAMDLAVQLFINEDQIVQVSSKNRSEIKTYKIAEYLNRLRVLPYKKVTIQWYDINFIGNFKFGTDGKYYAVATIFQKFQGYSGEGEIIYEDVTKKDIELVLDNRVKRIGDQEVKEWDVLLGNISVLETN